MGTFSATPSTAVTLSDVSPPFLPLSYPPAPTPASASLHPRTSLISSHLGEIYIHIYLRKLRTSESLARAKETLPIPTPETYSYLKQVERTEKEQEGARDGEKALERRRRKDRWDCKEKRETARQKGLHNQGWICPLLPTLAWGQRKVGTLKSVAFSDTQFRLVKGRKETRCVSASLGSVASSSQQCGWLDPHPPLLLPKCRVVSKI